jgi:hypothetical protein
MSERDAAYRATRFEIRDGTVAFTIRIGERCAPLDALLAQHGATSWVYVTAYNPGGLARGDAENVAANAAFARELAASERTYFRGAGVGADGSWAPEPSFLIRAPARGAAGPLRTRLTAAPLELAHDAGREVEDVG